MHQLIIESWERTSKLILVYAILDGEDIEYIIPLYVFEEWIDENEKRAWYNWWLDGEEMKDAEGTMEWEEYYESGRMVMDLMEYIRTLNK